MLLTSLFRFSRNDSLKQTSVVVKLCQFVFLASFLAFSSPTFSDGLFDFQMKLAQKGNAEAEFKVGEMYETGFGVKKDQKQAEAWINKATAQGHETAGFKLFYWNVKKKGLKGDNKKKFVELKNKAKDDNEQAMYYIGLMYAYGVGVKKNYDKSLNWLNKATFVGVLEAEREALKVRDMKQQALVKSRKAEERKKKKAKEDAQLKADEEGKLKAAAADKEKQDKADKDKKLADKKKQQAQADKKSVADAKKKEASAQKLKETKKRKIAEANRKKQALLKSNAEKKKKEEKDPKFDTDLCSGKSARFLSTCR